jgi:hypothetical protein
MKTLRLFLVFSATAVATQKVSIIRPFSESPSPAAFNNNCNPTFPRGIAVVEHMKLPRALSRQEQDEHTPEYTLTESGAFSAEIYTIKSPEVQQAAKEMDQFFTGPYPEWFHPEIGDELRVDIDYDVLTGKSGRWVKGPEGERAILVQDGVGFSAPGTMVGIFPLFVRECQES